MLKASLPAIFAAALMVPAAASASSDEQVWASASATVKLADKWRLSQELTTRFSDHRNGLYEIESNTLIGYRVGGGVTVWAGYTHDPQYAGGDFTAMEHRAREQLTIDQLAQVGSGKLSGRLRLEQRWREHVDGTGWRFRPYLKYSLPIAGKTALNLSTEPFFNLNTTAFQRQSGLDRVRNLVTVSTPVTKSLTGEVGYMNQHGFVRGSEDTSDNIAYFGLSLSL
jgi:opacity protein-like surface antigen